MEAGLKRYKCKGCNRTFNALTGTPLATLKHRDRWLAYAKALVDGVSLRKAAKRGRIDLTTAFRWRHRFLKVPKTMKAAADHRDRRGRRDVLPEIGQGFEEARRAQPEKARRHGEEEGALDGSAPAALEHIFKMPATWRLHGNRWRWLWWWSS